MVVENLCSAQTPGFQTTEVQILLDRHQKEEAEGGRRGKEKEGEQKAGAKRRHDVAPIRQPKRLYANFWVA
jgi:hypothetical protein